MLKIDTIKEPNFHMYKLTMLYILTVGAGVEVEGSEVYQYHRCVLFIRLLGIYISFEILGGSDNDIHFSIRLF